MLADLAHVSRPTLDHIEEGNCCDFVSFYKVFKVLEMTFEELESYHLTRNKPKD